MPFKMHNIMFFVQKKKNKKNMCAYPCLLPETHLFFYLA